VLHIDLKGKKIIEENSEEVWIECLAGENWHEFVLWTIDQGLEAGQVINSGNVELHLFKTLEPWHRNQRHNGFLYTGNH
jgi:hypothetical protein